NPLTAQFGDVAGNDDIAARRGQHTFGTDRGKFGEAHTACRRITVEGFRQQRASRSNLYLSGLRPNVWRVQYFAHAIEQTCYFFAERRVYRIPHRWAAALSGYRDRHLECLRDIK